MKSKRTKPGRRMLFAIPIYTKAGVKVGFWVPMHWHYRSGNTIEQITKKK